MDNVRPEGNEYQSVTSPSWEALGVNVHVIRSKRIRKYPQQYYLGCGDARECNNYDVSSIVYMIHYGGLNRNVDTYDILSLLDEWDAEYFMDDPSTFHMREYYVLKSQSHDIDNLTYVEALSCECAFGYYKAMDEKIQSLIRRDTWDIVSSKSVADHNVITGTWSFKYNSKPD